MIRYALILLLLAVTPAVAQQRGLAAWGKVNEVLSHPRCANCHVGGDGVPIWYEPHGVDPRPHGMNINGGASRIGVETILCGTCHTARNAELPHGPPGAPNWHLPPAAMQWYGRSSGEICRQLKDRARNGNRDIEAIARHVESDKLVAWGWMPGPGRAAAPYSAVEVAGYLREWGGAGAPCPLD